LLFKLQQNYNTASIDVDNGCFSNLKVSFDRFLSHISQFLQGSIKEVILFVIWNHQMTYTEKEEISRQSFMRSICSMSLLWKLLLFFFFAISTSQLFSQKRKQKESITSDLITSFSFKTLYGGVVLINATLDNLPDTLNFIFDTGSSGISLDSVLVDYLGLPKTPTERTLIGIASLRKITYIMDRTLHLPVLTLNISTFILMITKFSPVVMELELTVSLVLVS
jgi:hypothetical protein